MDKQEASATSDEKKPSKTELYAILARKSSKAVIFRRGPSNKVQLISWDRASDQFLLGQWFHGRIYQMRGDLSPSGEYLIYFAAGFKGRKDPDSYYSWTAVSKPPYLTALLLWPKDDCWGGGGLFESDTTIGLNHSSEDMILGEKWTLPKRFKVKTLAEWAGKGEDSPICDTREYRDGWRYDENLKSILVEDYTKTKISYKQEPAVLTKSQFHQKAPGYKLARQVVGFHEQNGPWYVQEYAVLNEKGRSVLPLGRCGWAEWDSNGDLLFARNGKLFRLKSDSDFKIRQAIELIDLSGSKPFRVTVPEFAKKW